MAKTNATRTIESLLKSYNPATIAGYRLNKFRDRHLAFECVVECGNISKGIVDCIRIDEILINEHRKRICYPGYHGNKAHYKDFVSPCGQTPTFCENTKCPYNSYIIEHEHDVLITCYEIKVTKADFHSKNGHNFVGNANYYVMPKALYEEIKNEIPDEIGVIIHCETDKFSGLRRVKECKLKTLSDTERMWLILNVLKRSKVEKKIEADKFLAKQIHKTCEADSLF